MSVKESFVIPLAAIAAALLLLLPPSPLLEMPLLLLLTDCAHLMAHSFLCSSLPLKPFLLVGCIVVQDSVTGFFSGSSEKDASSEKLDAFKGLRVVPL